MSKFVQLGDVAIAIDNIQRIEFYTTVNGASHIAITFVDSDGDDPLCLSGDIVARFLAWWEAKADVYRV